MKERIKTYEVNSILEYFSNVFTGKNRVRKEFDNVIVQVRFDKFETFKKSTDCMGCQLKGEFFALEKDNLMEEDVYHFTLYGIKDDKEINMTIDHVLPKSKGGTNEIQNLQTMCYTCNERKSDKLE